MDMSLDHKPTDSPELERIVRAGGQVGADSRVNGGLNLSRAIGRCTLHILLSWKYIHVKESLLPLVSLYTGQKLSICIWQWKSIVLLHTTHAQMLRIEVL